MNCADTNGVVAPDLTFEDTIKFLEPVLDEEGNPVRAGAVCNSAIDHEKKKTALEQACRMLGSRCTYEMQRDLGIHLE